MERWFQNHHLATPLGNLTTRERWHALTYIEFDKGTNTASKLQLTKPVFQRLAPRRVGNFRIGLAPEPGPVAAGAAPIVNRAPFAGAAGEAVTPKGDPDGTCPKLTPLPPKPPGVVGAGRLTLPPAGEAG